MNQLVIFFFVQSAFYFIHVDMKDIENAVRSVKADGLLWGACECYDVEGSQRVSLQSVQKSVLVQYESMD